MPKVIKKTVGKTAPPATPAPPVKVAPKPVSRPAPAPSKPAPAPAKGPAKPAPKPAKGDEHGKKSTVAEALNLLDEMWEGSEEKSGFDKLPAGKYQCRIEKAELGHSQNSRFQCVFELVVAGGEYVNRHMWKRDGLDNEDSIGWFKSGLTRLGVEYPKSDVKNQLPVLLESLVGSYCEVATKHAEGSDFVNVYFQKALDSSEVDTEGLETVEDDGTVEEPHEVRVFKKGDKVQGNFGGDWYQGVVKLVKGDKVTVTFEDGETHEMESTLIEPFDPDADAGTVEEPAAEEEGEQVEEPVAEEGGEEVPGESPVKLTFKEAQIVESLQTRIAAVAGKFEFNPNDYDTWLDLLQDVAEYCGLEGTFAMPLVLVKQLEAIKTE